jgi:hypothetical protein
MKTIFDFKNVKGTTAVCLLNKKTGKFCGRVIANWSDNPNGTVCTAQVILFNNAPTARSKDDFVNSRGKARGYGYDKLSAAIYSALRAVELHTVIKVESASGNQQQAFEAAGFVYIQVI